MTYHIKLFCRVESFCQVNPCDRVQPLYYVKLFYYTETFYHIEPFSWPCWLPCTWEAAGGRVHIFRAKRPGPTKQQDLGTASLQRRILTSTPLRLAAGEACHLTLRSR